MIGRAARIATFGLTLCGCADPDTFQTVRGTQLIAVRAEPPTARPGGRVTLELTYFDRTSFEADGAGPGVEVLWLAGCHDPEGDSPRSCLPVLGRRAIAALRARDGEDDPEIDALALAENTAFGSEYQLHLPQTSVADRVRSPGSLGYGISYVFYAVCRGKLTALPPATHKLPLACRDERGRNVPKADFTLGYTAVFVFEQLTSQNPPVAGVELDGEPVTRDACTLDADCPTSSALTYRCFEGACLPEVARCAGDCSPHRVRPLVPADAAEPDPTSVRVGEPPMQELIWVEYIGMGRVDRLESLIGERSGERRDSYAAEWTAPQRAFDRPIPFWTVVKDSRGGTTPARVDLLVK